MHNLCTSYDGGNGLLWAKDFYRLYLINTRTGRFCHDIKERFEAARLTEAFNDFILDHDRNAWIITESGKTLPVGLEKTGQTGLRATTRRKNPGYPCQRSHAGRSLSSDIPEYRQDAGLGREKRTHRGRRFHRGHSPPPNISVRLGCKPTRSTCLSPSAIRKDTCTSIIYIRASGKKYLRKSH